MKIGDIHTFISRYLLNLPGWHTKRKLLVIESDDWGSIRMPSKDIYDRLINIGIRVDKLSFNRFDSLASVDDLSSLFDVLTRFKDINGNHPIITANCVLTNPKFEEIKKSNFTEYHYELFTDTLKRYPSHDGSFKLWREGYELKLFHPQFHGREHINVLRWMEALKNDVSNIRMAFEMGMYDLSESGVDISENSFMDSLSFRNEQEYAFVCESIRDGLNIFEKIFGYRSNSFIAPCYIWDSKLEPTLANCGIKYIQGGVFQKSPINGSIDKFKRTFHYTGQKNRLKQRYIVRNCFFDPSANANSNIIEECLNRITAAFNLNKPAIISSHRVNYIGSIVPKNRHDNLLLLSTLLGRILLKHPEVEFKTSDQLGDLILNGTENSQSNYGKFCKT
jgi:hypothetical protein